MAISFDNCPKYPLDSQNSGTEIAQNDSDQDQVSGTSSDSSSENSPLHTNAERPARRSQRKQNSPKKRDRDLKCPFLENKQNFQQDQVKPQPQEQAVKPKSVSWERIRKRAQEYSLPFNINRQSVTQITSRRSTCDNVSESNENRIPSRMHVQKKGKGLRAEKFTIRECVRRLRVIQTLKEIEKETAIINFQRPEQMFQNTTVSMVDIATETEAGPSRMETAMYGIDSVSATAKKRRPKKTNITASVNAVLADIRRRGRPRKNNENNGNVSSGKRKRGRPRKNNENNGGGKKGRPRKNNENNGNVSTGKRKRGRPRKNNDNNGRRKRGRPRKNNENIDGVTITQKPW